MENQSQTTDKEVKRPSLTTRIKCTLTDQMVVIVLMIIASQVLESFENAPVWSRIVALSIIVLYEPILISYGRTIGQMAMGIRVVNHATLTNSGKLKRINIVASILRYIFKIILGIISLLTVTSDKNKRAIHDNITGSLMIQV